MTTKNNDALHPVGRLAGLFGLHGELKLDPTTAGEDLFAVDASFTARLKSGRDEKIVIEFIRPHKGRYLVRLRGVEGASRAEIYVNAELFAERERVLAELAEDEILDAELIGMQLCDETGRDLGAVVDVEHFPGSSMLAIGPKKALVPFVKAFIVNVDRSTRHITVNLPVGLLEGEAEEA